ncbi:right-handed parallel beta-helix repeat-containing protein, partial [Streptomyces sp. NPDC058231]|uniref:right-handed parallel beta-helix repeat-containing protein n=1 Tax=Streptomyces sp. NPDC058231 TaxID=3346392 RepID=UPI0036E9EC44
MSRPWEFGAADSGGTGHPVVWRAASGAHPVISGATRVTGWSQVGSTGVWSASVHRGSASRQLYVDGTEARVAQATPAALHFKGGWVGSATGYDLSKDDAAVAWFAQLTPTQLAQVEFDYPGGNGPWTDSKCRVASMSGSRLIMDQPCWTNVTDGAPFTQGSGGLPSMSTSQMPATIENARGLLQTGQWFLDSAASKLYYAPKNGDRVAGLDVELPRLETLLQGAGSLRDPLHDVTFAGLQFSYATWNDPSSTAGFADVQSNLRRTGANNQGLCTFSTPAGSCPWGALTQPAANVSFTASNHVTITGNRFVNLGGAGLSFKYGGSHDVIEGNEFTQIASTALLLGCT